MNEWMNEWPPSLFSLPPQNLAARSLAAASLADDTSSQHSSDQSDTRTEHSDDDMGDKAPKRSASVKTTKKTVAAKTEVRMTTSLKDLHLIEHIESAFKHFMKKLNKDAMKP